MFERLSMYMYMYVYVYVYVYVHVYVYTYMYIYIYMYWIETLFEKKCSYHIQKQLEAIVIDKALKNSLRIQFSEYTKTRNLCLC